MDNVMLPLEGKVAIVTGAGRLRGIGRAAAVALARLGANVTVTGTGRDPQKYPDDEKAAGWRDIESTAEEIRALGRGALPVVANATSGADAAAVAARTLKEFGRIDFLVNNAAYARAEDRAPLTELAEETWHKVIEVKLTGSFLMTQAVLPAMIGRKEGGAIVNLSSIAGKRGSANTAAYCTANAGIIGFTRAIAVELAPHNIRVNAVCPGLTDTSRMDDLSRTQNWQKLLDAMVPLRRAATDDEVGRLIAMLCSPDASYITGQAINIDGGAVMW